MNNFSILFILFLTSLVACTSQQVLPSESTSPQISSSDVWAKTEGYTVDNCYNVCEATYDMELQVSVCKGNCGNYGKPSASLDQYVNTVKDIKNRE